MNMHGWDEYALSLAKSMTELELYEDIVYERTFKGFYPGFWSNKKPEERLETLKLFLRHYVFNIRKLKIEDLYTINMDILLRKSKLYNTFTNYFNCKILKYVLYCIPELNVLKLRCLPNGFLDDEENRVIVVKHFIEKEEKLSDTEIYEKWSRNYLMTTRLSTLIRYYGYDCFNLLELAYPNKFDIGKFKHVGVVSIAKNRYTNIYTYPAFFIAKILFLIGCYCNINIMDAGLRPTVLEVSKEVFNYINAASTRKNNKITAVQWKERIRKLQESGELPTIDFDNLTNEEKFKMKLIAVRKLKDYIQLNDDVLEWYEENKDKDFPSN